MNEIHTILTRCAQCGTQIETDYAIERTERTLCKECEFPNPLTQEVKERLWRDIHPEFLTAETTGEEAILRRLCGKWGLPGIIEEKKT